MIHRILLPRVHPKTHDMNDVLQSELSEGLNASSVYSVPACVPPRATVTRSASQAAREYAELKHLMKQNGLLEKQPLYYLFKMVLLLGLLALGIILLLTIHSLWLQLLNASYLAFVSAQFGLLGHDAGHRQISRTTWKNDIVGLISGNLFLGMSHGWWMEKHNRHHSHPNQSDLDPDIDLPLLSVTGEDLSKKGTISQFIIKHQAIFFFPLLSLVALSLQSQSLRFLLLKREKYHILEVALMLVHFGAYIGVLFFSLGIWQAGLFMLVHQGLSGLYLGSIFAPNHKGMPVLDKESDMGFLYRQVVTARNVKAHPITDFWYGGLNYQIEHHLFPSMPRTSLPKAQRLIKAFCHEHAIPYYETSMLRSYQEILHYLHDIGSPLREARTQG
jgi:fatty acid desaturase